MKREPNASSVKRSGRRALVWLFPSGVLVLYLTLYVFAPENTLNALLTSGDILKQTVLPILLAFVVMFMLNQWVTPAAVTRFLGSGAGVRGVLLSSAAGIISMGPIYAWFPFLKTVREKGASDFHLANFLSNRAVKPVFLPLLIVYFGWRYALIFMALNMLGAICQAALVAFFNGKFQMPGT